MIADPGCVWSHFTLQYHLLEKKKPYNLTAICYELVFHKFKGTQSVFFVNTAGFVYIQKNFTKTRCLCSWSLLNTLNASPTSKDIYKALFWYIFKVALFTLVYRMTPPCSWHTGSVSCCVNKTNSGWWQIQRPPATSTSRNTRFVVVKVRVKTRRPFCPTYIESTYFWYQLVFWISFSSANSDPLQQSPVSRLLVC